MKTAGLSIGQHEGLNFIMKLSTIRESSLARIFIWTNQLAYDDRIKRREFCVIDVKPSGRHSAPRKWEDAHKDLLSTAIHA
jgi:hypothetical protein